MKLHSDKQMAGEKLCQQLGALRDVEAEEALKQAAKALSRLPIVVLEMPRQVSDMAVVRSCSGFAKTWGYDAELAKVIVLASSASMALSFDADARKRRFQVQPLSEEECQQEEAGLLSAFLSVFVWHSLTRSRRSSSTTVELPPSSTSRISSTSPAATWASWRPVHFVVFPALCLRRLGVLRSLSSRKDLAQALRTKTFEEVRLATIGAQDGVDLRLLFCAMFLPCARRRSVSSASVRQVRGLRSFHQR